MFAEHHVNIEKIEWTPVGHISLHLAANFQHLCTKQKQQQQQKEQFGINTGMFLRMWDTRIATPCILTTSETMQATIKVSIQLS